MKRSIFVALIALLTVSTVSAQFRVDREGIEKKLAKSDADTQHEKRGLRAATWMSRGDNYYEAATAPTSGTYVGMDSHTAKIMYGSKAVKKRETISGVALDMYSFKYFNAFFKDDKLTYWVPKIKLGGADPLGEAVKSYVKAYELDNGVADKVKAKLLVVADYHKLIGGNFYSVKKYKEAASEFIKCYEVSKLAPVNQIDTLSIYNAGFLYTATNEYQKGIDALKVALELGYEDKGELYRYMGFCYQGLKDYPKAKELLLTGITKYPTNNAIVEILMGLYSITGENPNEIIPYVEKAIAADPNNYVYYDGLGRIYDKLGDDDKCLEAFKKAAELAPKEFSTQFNLGMLFIRKGNSMHKAISNAPIATPAYDEAMEQQKKYFRDAIAPLEAAHNIDPKNADAVELLKNVCFRLRQEEGVMEKYNKYNALLKSLKQ